MSADDRPVVLGARFRRFPEFNTLGIRPNLADYPPEHLELIRRAPRVLYPTKLLAEPLAAAGRPIFPSLACHVFEGDKIKQTRLFELLGLPHPRTRVYFGRQRADIARDFGFPCIAKTPRGAAGGRGVFLLRGPDDLETYLADHPVAYIQERLPISADVRVVVMGRDPVVVYWRQAPAGGFRSNLAAGGRVSFDAVPPAAVELAVSAARAAGLDDVGLDVAMVEGRPWLLEFNMLYGRAGAAQAGLDLVRLAADRILAGLM